MNEYVATNNDFTKFEGEAISLIKVDKNGTHWYIDSRCPKCGGSGIIPYFGHVDHGVCFKCMGSGDGAQKFKVYTEEYHKILKEKRFARKHKEALAQNPAWLEKEGFSPEGKTWIVLGKTYEIKDQLKEAGAKFNRTIGWHFSIKPENFPVHEISVDTKTPYGEPIVETNEYGAYRYNLDHDLVEDYVKDINDKYLASIAPETRYVGEVGDKVSFEEVTGKCVAGFDTQWGVSFIYKFTTPEGDTLVWKTSKDLDLDKPVSIKGTVKELKEYKGVKETVLTRCKVC
jgi:hypothetical protein